MPRRRTPTPHDAVAGPFRCRRARARRLVADAGPREILRFATVAGAVALILTGLAAVQPTPAYANPVKDAVKDALEWLFSMPELHGATEAALRFLVKVPNYIENPGKIAALGQTTTAIAGASLAAIATLAVVHYWAAGVSLSDSGDPVEAVPRTVGAGLFILAWPWIFTESVALTNVVTNTLISTSNLAKLAPMIFALHAVDGFGMLASSVLGLAMVIVMIGIVLTKIALVAALAVLFAGVPLAVGLYPLPSLSWVAQFALKLFVAILMIFITWALELAVIGALGQEYWSGYGSWAEKLTKPFIGIAVLILMMSTAKQWLRVAGVLSGGGGMVRHTLGWAAGHLAFNAAAQHIPDALGGRADSIARQQQLVARKTTQDAERTNGDFQPKHARGDSEPKHAEGSREPQHAKRSHGDVAAPVDQQSGPTASDRKAHARDRAAGAVAAYGAAAAAGAPAATTGANGEVWETTSEQPRSTASDAPSRPAPVGGDRPPSSGGDSYALRPDVGGTPDAMGSEPTSQPGAGTSGNSADASPPSEAGTFGGPQAPTEQPRPPATEQPSRSVPPEQPPAEAPGPHEPPQQPATSQPPPSPAPPPPAEPPEQP
jgi:hypothetical protein